MARISNKTSASQATLYDVSRRSGVSTATVSRVFSGSSRVSGEVRRRVTEAAQELSYMPSHAAQSLAARRTNTLGVIFPDIASGFYADVLAGIDEVAAEQGLDVLAAFVGRQRKGADLIQRLGQRSRVDALVVMNLENTIPLEPWILDRMPVVQIDRRSQNTSLPTVSIDNIGGAEAMIEHLYEQGHRKIAVLAGPEGTFDAEERLIGARQAAARLGLRLDDEDIWKGAFTLASGIDAARNFLASRKPLPDAIFCLNDSMAIGVLDEFKRAGISAPRDIALAGFDDVDAAEHLSLTSIACPMRLMGQVAARVAVDLLAKEDRRGDHRLQVRLVVRQSSSGKSPTFDH